MSGSADTFRRLSKVLMNRPEVRSRAGRLAAGGLAAGVGGASLRPNAPRMITVLVAIALTIVGIAVSITAIEPVLELLAEANLDLTKEQGWAALLASPALLVLGSFFRGL